MAEKKDYESYPQGYENLCKDMDLESVPDLEARKRAIW